MIVKKDNADRSTSLALFTKTKGRTVYTPFALDDKAAEAESEFTER